MAANKALVLNDSLGACGGLVRHREVQNHESKEFMSLFPNNVIE